MLMTRRRMLSGTALMGGAIIAGCKGKDDDVAVSDPPGTFEPPTTPDVPDDLPGVWNAKVAERIPLSQNWTFRPAIEIKTATGDELSKNSVVAGFDPAVVPGTPLTSMIANKKYPDPLYRNIVTNIIPDSLSTTDYWYHTSFKLEAIGPNQRQWIRFDGINYLSNVWINGQLIGKIEGAFMRGIFDITDVVGRDGGQFHMAVLIYQWDLNEGPILPNLGSGVTRGGRNGGKTGIALKNGPTFFCSSGWDWLPTVPDRNYGIWQPVSHYVTGSVWFGDVQVNSLLNDDLSEATIKVKVPLKHLGAQKGSYSLRGLFGDIKIHHEISLSDSPGSDEFEFEVKVSNPKLWWPNGYGEPHLYALQLDVYFEETQCDTYAHKIGIRKFGYVKKSGRHDRQMTVVVNNHPILAMGGNWGLDEAFKRIPKEKIYHAVKLHRDANLNMIRNWNGQSTSEDLFAACDEHGILVWQDFFYSTEGGTRIAPQNPIRAAANMRDCILKYRNHASLYIWCGGNEGDPNQIMIDHLAQLVTELDPGREYVTSSAGDIRDRSVAIAGFKSGGPYHFVGPKRRFQAVTGTDQYAFHNELGSYSIPTLEFTKKMIPVDKWECPDNSWADRDFNANGGNNGGLGLINAIGNRYGKVRNLADFVRKSQLMNFEEHRAIYESHIAKMLNPSTESMSSPATGALLWMTHPAQPSFVWQMYSHDHETFGTFFGIKNACTRVTALLDCQNKQIVVANHTLSSFNGSVTVTVSDLGGQTVRTETVRVQNLEASSHRQILAIGASLIPASTAVMFIAVQLSDTQGKPLKESIYWQRTDWNDTNFKDMDEMPRAALTLAASVQQTGDETLEIEVKLRNLSQVVSLMNHLQIYDKSSKTPVTAASFTDNYISLQGKAERVVKISVPLEGNLNRDDLTIRIDGWNIDNALIQFERSPIELLLNTEAEAYRPEEPTFNACRA